MSGLVLRGRRAFFLLFFQRASMSRGYTLFSKLPIMRHRPHTSQYGSLSVSRARERAAILVNPGQLQIEARQAVLSFGPVAARIYHARPFLCCSSVRS